MTFCYTCTKMPSLPVEVGRVSSDEDLGSWVGGWDHDVLSVELDDVLAVEGAGLGGEDGAGDDLVGGEPDVVPDGGQWEEQVVWVGDADVAEQDLLSWPVRD